MRSPMFEILQSIIRRDLTLVMRRRADVLVVVFFFVIVMTLFPLGVGPQVELLQLIAPGIFWVAALLASMLALERLFLQDYQEGSLDQFLLSAQPVSLIVAGKVFAHWLVTGLPLVVLSPLLGLQYQLPTDVLWVLALSLLLGTPVLSLLGAIGSALVLGIRGSGAVIALLVLPLYVPVLIFGAGAVEAQATGLGASSHLMLLAAMLILSLFLAPLATASALRIAVE